MTPTPFCVAWVTVMPNSRSSGAGVFTIAAKSWEGIPIGVIGCQLTGTGIPPTVARPPPGHEVGATSVIA